MLSFTITIHCPWRSLLGVVALLLNFCFDKQARLMNRWWKILKNEWTTDTWIYEHLLSIFFICDLSTSFLPFVHFGNKYWKKECLFLLLLFFDFCFILKNELTNDTWILWCQTVKNHSSRNDDERVVLTIWQNKIFSERSAESFLNHSQSKSKETKLFCDRLSLSANLSEQYSK